MKIIKQNKKDCIICKKLFIYKEKEIDIDFDGNNYLSITKNENGIFLKIKWLGCDMHKYDYYGESSCNKNDTVSVMKLYYCPFCGSNFNA